MVSLMNLCYLEEKPSETSSLLQIAYHKLMVGKT